MVKMSVKAEGERHVQDPVFLSSVSIRRKIGMFVTKIVYCWLLL